MFRIVLRTGAVIAMVSVGAVAQAEQATPAPRPVQAAVAPQTTATNPAATAGVKGAQSPTAAATSVAQAPVQAPVTSAATSSAPAAPAPAQAHAIAPKPANAAQAQTAPSATATT